MSPPSTTDIDIKRYGVEMSGLDFGCINAPNQFVNRCLSPLADMLRKPIAEEHFVNSGTKYTVKIMIVSERDASLI